MANDQKFSQFVSELSNGVTDMELTDALKTVIDAVGRIGKPGSVRLTLKVSKRGDMISVVEKIDAAVPDVRDEKLFWMGLEGAPSVRTLSRCSSR